VRITQREPGGTFYRIMSTGKNQQDWKSLMTRDKGEALSRAKQFLCALHTIETQARSTEGQGSMEESNVPPVSAPETIIRESQDTGGAAPLALGTLFTLFMKSSRFKKLDEATQYDLERRARIIIAHFGIDRDVSGCDSDEFDTYAIIRSRGGIAYEAPVRSRTGRDLGTRKKVSRSVGARSVEADLKLFRMVVIWAMRKKFDGRRLLQEDPMEGVEISGEINPKRPVATHERFEKTLAEIHRLAGAETDAWARQLWVMLGVALVVLEGTGRRLSAVLGLLWSDLRLDEENGFRDARITFRSHLDKKRRAKELPLLPDVARELARYRLPQSFAGLAERVFPDRDGKAVVNGDRLRQLLGEAEIGAGLDPLDGSKFHAYRRKFATERGHRPDHEVMELMGITDPKVFGECYRKRSDEQLREGLSSVHRVNDLKLERVA
jgi:integrase